MSKQKGELVVCDRCGKELFLKYIGEKELDGGFSRSDRFEPLPNDWLDVYEIGYLCPHCTNTFKDLIHDFMSAYDVNNVNKIKITWRRDS